MLSRWLLSLSLMNQFLLASHYPSAASSALWAFTELKIVKAFLRRRQWHPTPVLLPGKSHGWRSLVGCMQSMGSGRVEHDWETSLSLFTLMHWRRKWQPTPVFLPGESQGRVELPSLGSHRVGHDWSDLAAAAAAVFRFRPSYKFTFDSSETSGFSP